jgi:hypothetical protein
MISSPNLKVVYYKATESENRLKLRVPLPKEQSPNHILPPFQFVGRFGISRFIKFVMHLDIYLSRYMLLTILDLPKRPTIWN